MSYLDNSEIVVDSILTKRGRELFSKGQFKISKFALADDEVDYRLYNTAHPSGSNYYGAAITNMPVLEALPDGSKTMKYKLITLPKGTTKIPLITVGSTSISLVAKSVTYPGTSDIITPSTIGGLNETLGYTATLYDTSYVDLLVGEKVSSTAGVKLIKNIDDTSSHGIAAVGKTFILRAKGMRPADTSATTTLVIVGNETGGSITINITITANVAETQ